MKAVKNRRGPKDILAKPRGRGRPPKERFSVPAGFGNPITAVQRSRLRAELIAADKKRGTLVKGLTEKQLGELAEELAHAIGAFHAMEQAARSVPAGGRGNRNHTAVQVLLHDCARAWAEVTGQEPKLHQDSETGRQTAPVALARIALTIATGKNYSATLRGQAAKARRIQGDRKGAPARGEFPANFVP